MTVIWVLVGVVVVATYLSWLANRLDRLHTRLDGARASLDAQLVRRASVTLELATSGLLDPATSMLLAAAAHEAREAPSDAREVAESDLTKALGAAFANAGDLAEVRAVSEAAVLLDELEESARRVALARRFHNDAVRATRVVRRIRLVRLLRLAGRAPYPSTFEMDDTVPRVGGGQGEAPAGAA